MKTFKKWGRSTTLIAVDWMLPAVEERRILKMDRKVKRKKSAELEYITCTIKSNFC